MMQKRIASLPTEIQAIQHELSAKGLVKSGAMLKRVLATCKASIEAQSQTVLAEYEWAVRQALFASQSWVERLVVDASESLEHLYEATQGHIYKACHLAGTPELAVRLLRDLETTKVAAKDSIALSLRSRFAERSRGLIRGLPSLLSRVISRIFGGGGA
ncbi:hypothetical protein [Methylocaldum sp.]|uniref:hypothetical protein n=1 Tax=Methylocaldum sp. TaxID=1969727 RepID=UPI002D2345CF|nr:hypothetical protein [Methylocaldum sp.]HYE37297.1 hypothetical protein [Methylocaldum sp.]